MRPGDLVAFDTDMMGPEEVRDVIAFLCGDKPTPLRRRPTGWPTSSTRSWPDCCVPGWGMPRRRNLLPEYPDAYRGAALLFRIARRGHGRRAAVFPVPRRAWGGEARRRVQENMVVSVEFYAGKVGEQDGGESSKTRS